MSSSLFSGIYAGLTNTYSVLAAQYADGLTLEDIAEARTDSSNLLTLNQTFASYLQSNFSSIDTDNDGVISSDELSYYTSLLSSQGLTKTELSQLYASGASGLSSETIENILEHFDEMDADGDGRVTESEISAYKIDCARQEKVDEYAHKFATNMSLFYGDDDSSSSDVDSYSMLSYRYKDSSNS